MAKMTGKKSQAGQAEAYRETGIGTDKVRMTGKIKSASNIPGGALDPKGATSQSHMRGKI